MKRLLSVFFTILMILSLFGCSSTVMQKSPKNHVITEVSYSEVDGYIHCQYEKYNCSAIENGLSGTKIYDDVLIKDLIIEGESILLLVENVDANEYIVVAGTYPFYTDALLKPLVGSNVRMFFEYIGYSEEREMPLCYMYPEGKIELSSGTIYKSADLKASREQFKTWVAENCQVIQPDQIHKFVAMSVMVTGYAADVIPSDSQVIFRLRGSSANGDNLQAYCLQFEDFPDAKEITEGSGIIMYGFVEEHEFHPVYLEFRDPDLALDELHSD